MSEIKGFLDKILDDNHVTLRCINDNVHEDDIILRFLSSGIQIYNDVDERTNTCNHFCTIKKEWIEDRLLDILIERGYDLKYTHTVKKSLEL